MTSTFTPETIARKAARLLTKEQQATLKRMEADARDILTGVGDTLAARAARDILTTISSARWEDSVERVTLNNAENDIEDRTWYSYDPSAQ